MDRNQQQDHKGDKDLQTCTKLTAVIRLLRSKCDLCDLTLTFIYLTCCFKFVLLKDAVTFDLYG